MTLHKMDIAKQKTIKKHLNHATTKVAQLAYNSPNKTHSDFQCIIWHAWGEESCSHQEWDELCEKAANTFPLLSIILNQNV
jgi:hypothetical protein